MSASTFAIAASGASADRPESAAIERWKSPVKAWTARPFVPDITCLAWHPDGSRVAALSDASRRITMLDRTRGKQTDSIMSPISMGPFIGFANGGRNIFSGRWPEDGGEADRDVFTVLSADPLAVERHVPSPLLPPGPAKGDYIACNAGGTVAAARVGGAGNGGLVVFNTTTWEPLAVFPDKAGSLYASALAVSPDGRNLAASTLGKIRVCDIASLACGPEVRVSFALLQSVRFSPDGSYFVTGILNIFNGVDRSRAYPEFAGEEIRYVKFWRTADLAKIAEIRSPVRQVNGLHIHPRLPLVAVAGSDAVYLFHTGTGDLISTVLRVDQGSWTRAVAFAPDGECLAVGLTDRVALFCLPTA